MSSILPIQIINSLRNSNNVAIQTFGIDVTLYLATNDTAVENLDDYQTPADYQYIALPLRAWFEWSPNTYRLRKLGLFNEKDLPGLVHFDNRVEITRYSYVHVPITFLPSNQKDAQDWEVIDQAIPNLADIDVKRVYKLAPRRVPNA